MQFCPEPEHRPVPAIVAVQVGNCRARVPRGRNITKVWLGREAATAHTDLYSTCRVLTLHVRDVASHWLGLEHTQP